MTRFGATKPRCFELGLPPFPLEAGPELPRLHLSGWWWGPPTDLQTLEARGRMSACTDRPTPRALDSPPFTGASGPALDPRVPTVLLIHALTGDAQAGGDGGWWGPVIGPGRALDPTRSRLLCFNNLGGCYGSFGGLDLDWPWMDAPRVGAALLSEGLRLPAPLSTWDQARAILRALDALGVDTVRAVIGGSLGGMVVLALGALAPARFEQLLPVAASEAASPWIIGFNHVARQAILLDPGWPQRPTRGLALARQLGQMTYRAEPGLAERQGRLVRPDRLEGAAPFTERWSATLPYAQETYLEHQGAKLVARFDAASYLVQLSAMDHHDLERRPPDPDGFDSWDLGEGPWLGRARLPAVIDAVGIASDVLYPPVHMQNLAATAQNGRYHEIRSPHGHDAFLIEWAQLDAILRAAGAPFDGAQS